MKMNACRWLSVAVAGASLWWITALLRHEEQIKFMHHIQTGEVFGCDCTWASLQECGGMFRPTQIKSLRTGEVTNYPLMG